MNPSLESPLAEAKEGRSPNRPSGGSEWSRGDASDIDGQTREGEFPGRETNQTAAPWKAGAPERGWIFYDGQCRYCFAMAKQFGPLFARRGFEFLPLQTPWVLARLGLEPGVPLEEMRLLTIAGTDLGGADAVIFLLRQIWWLWPFHLIARLPGMHGLVDRSYRWIAAHRGCTHIGCATKPGRDDLVSSHYFGDATSSSLPNQLASWIGLLVLPTLALFTRDHVAPSLFMWSMAGALFLGCKWLTFWRARQTFGPAGPGQVLGYFFLWAGMDASSFLRPAPSPVKVSRPAGKIAFSLIKIVFGLLMLYGLARLAPNHLVAGWIGMVGMIFILHFGLFDLSATAWRMAGVDANPIMNAPIKAQSLNEFWGRRWNGAFNQLVLDIFFRPLARSVGTVRATLTAFLISGLLHELVISLPAGAGYGLPTAYFLLQGWGVIVQRSAPGKRWGLRQGKRGWMFTMLLTAGPAFWLFHPPFVERVIIPFMQAIHAL
jgi:predicted DCC family thiol-disulfide oxidoreductase YuxK